MQNKKSIAYFRSWFQSPCPLCKRKTKAEVTDKDGGGENNDIARVCTLDDKSSEFVVNKLIQARPGYP